MKYYIKARSLFNFGFFLLFVFSIPTSSIAQKDKLISVKKLKKDLKDLRTYMEAFPDPYAHISESDFVAKRNAIESSVDHPLTKLEFYKKVSAIVALLKDGHSRTSLPKKWLMRKRKAVGAFPYEMYLTNDDELFVIKNFNKGEIPVKSKILEINDITVDSFLNIITPYISFEKKRFRNTLIDDDIEKYLYVAFGHSADTKIKYVSLVDTLTCTVKNMDYKIWKKTKKNNRDKREEQMAKGKPYSYKTIKNGVGLLSIYAFHVSNLQNYEIFLKKTFKKIRKENIHSLIIDVRGNYGGWPKIESKLFHYITNLHFKTMAKSQMKVSYAYRQHFVKAYPALRANKDIYIRQRRHYLDINAILKNEYGTFVNEDAFFNEDPEKKQYEFYGDCYLLTNRDSYSAASSFASTFQCYQMGPIIGEETGGTKIFRANSIWEPLQRSGVWVSISTTKLFTACYNEEFEGVKPNLEFTPSILQLTSDLDTQLFYALSVIKKVQKAKKKALEEKEKK